MNKEQEAKINAFFSLASMGVTGFELLFVTAVPIYLWGWLRGLLVASALTSGLHIVFLLKRLIVVISAMKYSAPSKIVRP